ncbi:hypothetical protein ACFQ14_14395 [Pseudahrensia aquimaris]|uniref:Secreted protein n=1 Tax=Pseudahrensia aquimaris TaxID=744461 RepID=A0ABW3FIH6_9HYPH
MLKTLFLAGALTTSLVALPTPHAHADDRPNTGPSFKVDNKHSKKHNRSRYRNDDRYNRRNNGNGSLLRPSVVVVGGNTARSSASANGNTVTISPGEGEPSPLNRVSEVVEVNELQQELAAARAALREARGGVRAGKSFTIIAGANFDGERVPSPVYMPETYSESIDGDGKVIYFDE